MITTTPLHQVEGSNVQGTVCLSFAPNFSAGSMKAVSVGLQTCVTVADALCDGVAARLPQLLWLPAHNELGVTPPSHLWNSFPGRYELGVVPPLHLGIRYTMWNEFLARRWRD